MSFSELAVAFGLLAPLILGVIGLIDKRLPDKKPAKGEKPVMQGMPVSHDYAGELLAELRSDIVYLKSEVKKQAIRADRAESERDTYKTMLEGKR